MQGCHANSIHLCPCPHIYDSICWAQKFSLYWINHKNSKNHQPTNNLLHSIILIKVYHVLSTCTLFVISSFAVALIQWRIYYIAAGLNFFIFLIYWVLKLFWMDKKEHENYFLFRVVIMLRFILNSFANNFIHCFNSKALFVDSHILFVEKCTFPSMWLLHLQTTHFLVIGCCGVHLGWSSFC